MSTYPTDIFSGFNDAFFCPAWPVSSKERWPLTGSAGDTEVGAQRQDEWLHSPSQPVPAVSE